MALYTSPFVLLGMANNWTAQQTMQSGVVVPSSVATGLDLQQDSAGSGPSLTMGKITFTQYYGQLSLYVPGNLGVTLFYAGQGSGFNAGFNAPLSIAGGMSVESGQAISGAGSLNLTGTGEFGGLFTAAGGIETAGGGTAPTAFSPGASGTATAVSTSRNVTLICTAAGTQSADGEVNGVSIGAQWAAGMVVPLKANDTVTWTGTAAPTFLYMYA